MHFKEHLAAWNGEIATTHIKTGNLLGLIAADDQPIN